ncbi:MAG: response regulator [Phycisphaeraceae bacterium]|nr:response regulator [Phycisphaeraceae bacterium]MCW5762539.1 response regulator [Phycisphaeraceae bacterium]
MSTLNSKHILIVDNDPAVVTALAARLSANGYRCTTANCGSQALARFDADPPDLIISDLNMPQGDGVALAESIRRVSVIPIILISGFKDAYRKQLRHVRDILFLHKPFVTEELVRLVASAIADTELAVAASSRTSD